MQGDVLGAVERRHRWTDAEKFAVVCGVGPHGASVTQVAQRHDLRRQQIYAFRHDLRKKGLCEPEGAALFLPINIAPPSVFEAKAAADIAATMVEIVLRNGRQIRCRGGIGDDDLAGLIRLVEAA
jgi:transposase